jgi:hypothetical protein
MRAIGKSSTIAWRILYGLGLAWLFSLSTGILPLAAQTEIPVAFEDGTLTVTLTGSEWAAFECVGGLLSVNGVSLSNVQVRCGALTTIIVRGGSGRNQIDLSSVTRPLFPVLVSVTVDGGAGDDVIIASEFADTLNGGDGQDTFVGTQQDDRVDGGAGQTWFLEATRPSYQPPIAAELAGPPAAEAAFSRAPSAPGLGTTIDAVNFITDAANSGFYHIPPDPIGVAGPNHVVNVVNTSIQWYTKAGGQQNNQRLGRNSSTAAGSFFELLSPINGTFDPKVIYDQYAGRFLVVTLEMSGTTTNNPDNVSRILLAVSDDSDPNGTWTYQAIDAKLTISGGDSWADYPGFAVDEEAVYVTANMFRFTGGSSIATRLWIIHKSPFYSGGAASVTVHDPYAGGGIATTTQPAHMFGTSPAAAGTFLVSYSGLSGGGNEAVQVVRVDNPLTTPSFNVQQPSLGNIDVTTVAVPNAPQLGTGTLINTNDRRALQAVWRDNALWVTFTTRPISGEATAHWVKVNTSNLTTLSIADQGAVTGEDIAAGTYTFFPSIAVDPCGNMAIGFAASASTIYPGAYYTGRLASDPAGTVQSSAALAVGQDYYVRTFGAGRNRWGDYSGISLDPSDEATFWVFNQYAMTRGTAFGGEDGRWATRFGSFTLNADGFDFGDLPGAYNLAARSTDGARHCYSASGPRLGSLLDAESDGQASATADGDDTAGLDDEDGIARALMPWSNGAAGGAITATVTGGSGVLNGYVDWNGDNDFADPSEQVMTNTAVSAGANLIQFAVPAGTFPGGIGPNLIFNARFRLTAAAPVSAAVFYAGSSSAGEVEDDQWNFTPTAVTFQQAQAQSGVYYPLLLILSATMSGVMALLYLLKRKRV